MSKTPGSPTKPCSSAPASPGWKPTRPDQRLRAAAGDSAGHGVLAEAVVERGGGAGAGRAARGGSRARLRGERPQDENRGRRGGRTPATLAGGAAARFGAGLAGRV